MTEARILALISAATLVPLDQLVPEARPEELGIDSLGLVESIFAIEEEFGIRIPFAAHPGETSGIDVSTIGTITAGVQALIVLRETA